MTRDLAESLSTFALCALYMWLRSRARGGHVTRDLAESLSTFALCALYMWLRSRARDGAFHLNFVVSAYWGERSEPLPSQLNVNFVCLSVCLCVCHGPARY